jgi:hypothetical protein
MPEGTLQERLVGITVADLRKAAPVLVEQLVSEMQTQAGVEQMHGALTVVREVLEVEGEEEEALLTAIKELQISVSAAQDALGVIRSALGIGEEAPATEIAAAVSEMASERRQVQIDAALAEAVANEAIRPAVRAVVVAEMRASEEPVADVAEFVGELVKRDDVKAIIDSAALAPRMPAAPVKRDNRQKEGYKYLN